MQMADSESVAGGCCSTQPSTQSRQKPVASCPCCSRLISVTLKGVFRQHGPISARCPGSGLRMTGISSAPITAAAPLSATAGSVTASQVHLPTTLEQQTTTAEVYDEIVHWDKRFFPLPDGAEGKSFVSELANLLRAYVESEGAAHEALLGSFVLPALLLQRTNDQSQAKQQKVILHRRMAIWREGNICELLSEGRCLQDSLAGCGHSRGRGRPRSSQLHDEARTFRDLVGRGHIHQAIRSLSDNSKRG